MNVIIVIARKAPLAIHMQCKNFSLDLAEFYTK